MEFKPLFVGLLKLLLVLALIVVGFHLIGAFIALAILGAVFTGGR